MASLCILAAFAFLRQAAAQSCMPDSCVDAAESVREVAVPICSQYLETPHNTTTSLPLSLPSCLASPSKISSICSCLLTTPTRASSVAPTWSTVTKPTTSTSSQSSTTTWQESGWEGWTDTTRQSTTRSPTSMTTHPSYTSYVCNSTPTVTVTLSGSRITSTVTNTITASGSGATATVTLPASTVTNTVTVSGPGATATVTLPASTITNTVTLPASTISNTVTLPASTITNTVTLPGVATTITVPPVTTTLTLPPSTVTNTVTSTVTAASGGVAVDQNGCPAVNGDTIFEYVIYCGNTAGSGSFAAATAPGYNIEDCSSQCFDNPDGIDCLGVTYTQPNPAFSGFDGHLNPGTCTFYEFVTSAVPAPGVALAVFENTFATR